MARQKKKTEIQEVNPTPLFDAERYDSIMNAINTSLEKLQRLQVDIMTRRSENMVEYAAANRKRELEDRKEIRSLEKKKLTLKGKIAKPKAKRSK